jgi:hypothetical protein
MNYLYKICITTLLLLILSGCTRQPRIVRKITCHVTSPKNTQTYITPQITIWVHGSQFLRPAAELVHGAPDGIHKIIDLPSYYHLRSLAKTVSKADPAHFPLEHFYAFGWSGKLDFFLREKEAEKLLYEIKKLVAHYRTQFGYTPAVRLITHSHGGNVALNLAKVKDHTTDFTITALILMGCPIQDATQHFAHDPFFNRVYSLYASMDTIQLLDPQGLYNLPVNEKRTLKFSHRCLPIGSNVRQVRLKINGHSLLHLSFLTKGFLKLLPTILDEIDYWYDTEPSSTTCDQERVLSLRIRTQRKTTRN